MIRSLFIGLALMILLPVFGTAQGGGTTPNTWQLLANLTYTKQFDELLGFKVDVPVFSDEVQEMDGQEITVRGYIIPVQGYKSHTEFIFSAFPYSMCFFCGGAGPETVMEVYADDPVPYQADPVTLRGTLQLNDSDINQLMYILTEATLVEE